MGKQVYQKKFIKQPTNRLDADPVMIISGAGTNDLPDYASKVNTDSLEHSVPMVRKRIDDFLNLTKEGVGVAADTSTATYGGEGHNVIDFYNTKKKIEGIIEKSKIYFQPEKGEKPPKGAKVQRGSKGGYYYEGVLPGRQWEKGAIKDIEWVKAKAGGMTLGGVRIPNTWKEGTIFMNRDKKAEIQATGVDQKNRSVYVKLPQATTRSIEKKFIRLKNFNNDHPKILQYLELHKDKRDEAMILWIQSQTAARIGSKEETTGKEPSYGISTVLREHAKVEGDKVTLTYPGKDGVTNINVIKDSGLAKKISKIKNPKRRIFDVDYKQIMKYFREFTNKNYNSHDFRTWIATNTAIKAVKKYPKPSNEKELRKLKISVGKEVAKKLGNTYSVALAHYIAPDVWTPFEARLGSTIIKKAEASDDPPPAYPEEEVDYYYGDIADMLETIFYGDDYEGKIEELYQTGEDDEDEIIEKAKIYLSPNEQPPEGYSIQIGPYGGRFYETKLKTFEHIYRRAHQRLIEEDIIDEALDYLDCQNLPSVDWWYKVSGNGIIVGSGDVILSVLRPSMRAMGIRIK